MPRKTASSSTGWSCVAAAGKVVLVSSLGACHELAAYLAAFGSRCDLPAG